MKTDKGKTLKIQIVNLRWDMKIELPEGSNTFPAELTILQA